MPDQSSNQPSPVELGSQSQRELLSEHLYSGTVAEVRRYGTAALLILHEKSAEEGRLAVWVHDSVFQTSRLSPLRSALGDGKGVARLERRVLVRVRGCFRGSQWTDRLTVDVLSPSDIEVELRAAQ